MLAYTLLLPGATLNLSALLMRKKFVGKGNKEGAVEAFRELEKAGLGKLVEMKAQRGTACVSVCHPQFVRKGISKCANTVFCITLVV